jgi:hypothetical protein
MEAHLLFPVAKTLLQVEKPPPSLEVSKTQHLEAIPPYPVVPKTQLPEIGLPCQVASEV